MLARGGHEAIAKNERYDAASPFIVSLGLAEPLFNQIMRGAGLVRSRRGHWSW